MISLVFLIIRPFITALLGSVFLAYLLYPVYKWLNKKIKIKSLSSLIVTVFVILLLLLPLFFVLNTLTKEAYVTYLTSKQKILSIGDVLKECPEDNPFCGIITPLGAFLDDPKVKYYMQNAVEKVTSYIIDSASDLIFSIPKFVLNFFVMIFVMFYSFKDGPKIMAKLKRILPLRDVYKKHLFEKFGKTTFAIVYGYIVVAIMQGILGGIGFLIFGVNSPFIWGIVMVFAALIPFIGTGLIWLPPALLKLINGISTGDQAMTIGGVLFILYGIIIISSLDNILRPKIIGKKAKVHPVLVLVGVLGGLHLLGFVGLVVGPLILALFITFIQAYERDRYRKK
jgi:predicted PurR-regulated permease PerM